jgi:hypothetical protein
VSAPREAMQSMALACAKGQTPPELTEFLRAQFPDTRRPGFISSMFTTGRSYAITHLEPFKGGLLRQSAVFTLYARDPLLEGRRLDSGDSFGLCAIGERGLSYLHRREQLVEVLRAEGQIAGLDALAVATFLAEAIGRKENHSHTVLASAEHLAHFGGAGEGGYELFFSEWDRCHRTFVHPTLTPTGEHSWQVDFCSVFGWNAQKQELRRTGYRFDPERGLEVVEQVLSRKIFKSMPKP